MEYDIIFIVGEKFADHPLSGIGILKRLLEKYDFSVAVIDSCMNEKEVLKFGKPKLFFGVSSGSVDSMVRNYTPLKKSRAENPALKFVPTSPDRAVTVYCNWIKQYFKESKIVVGGVEGSLRRFSHYDYWENKIRKSILFDSRADILVYGPGEKQILEIASRIKEEKELSGILGTCIRSRELPKEFTEMPSYEEIFAKSKNANISLENFENPKTKFSKEILKSNKKFCEMQNLLSNKKNLAQKTGNFYVLQYKSPEYTSKNLDEYYELPFTRNISGVPELQGFEFSVVTHRGCIGNCNFCSLRLMAGDKIISRSEESIIREIKYLTTLPNFKGNVDDFGGPSANMYGMDCKISYNCEKACIECKNLNRTHKRLIELLRKVRQIPKVKKVFVRSGVRFDLVNEEYLKELVEHHISGKLKIAPEHVSENVLKSMNKNRGDLNKFIKDFHNLGKGELSFYFMSAHPGSTMEDAKILAEKLKTLKNCESVQTFTPTPMTTSTCMYYTECDPATGKKIYVPKTYKEKKDQKRILFKGKNWGVD